jgi:hypothetical protein
MPYRQTPTDLRNLARRYLGTKEDPAGSNRQMFGAWYGMNGVFWCAEYVSYVLYLLGFRFAGATTKKGWSYVPSIVDWGKKYKRISRTPHFGDVACYLNGDEHHTGFVFGLRKGEFLLHSGNSGPSSLSNGGMVYEEWRSVVPSHGEWYFVTPPWPHYDTQTPAKPVPARKSAAPIHRHLALVSPIMTGSDIGWLQNRLRQLGLRTIRADKRYDEVTRKQVIAFQKSQGLTVDGVVGPITAAHLQDAKKAA